MELNELKRRISNSLSAITGEDARTVSNNNVNEILKVFAKEYEPNKFKVNVVDSVIIESLDSAPREYFGSTKIPSPQFWHRVKRDKQSKWNTNHLSSTDKFKRPSEQEKGIVVQMASAIAAKFEAMSPQHKEQPSRANAKVDRYKGYVERDMVRVEDDTHSMHDEWIERVRAVSLGVSFHDPVVWLDSRNINSGVSRETFSL